MRLVLRQQSNAFPQPWCGNRFARDGSSPGAHQKPSPAAHLHQPTHTLPGSRLNVPQPYRTGYHDFQIKVVKFQQKYQKSHRSRDSGIVGRPLDADSLDGLLIHLFDRVQ